MMHFAPFIIREYREKLLSFGLSETSSVKTNTRINLQTTVRELGIPIKGN